MSVGDRSGPRSRPDGGGGGRRLLHGAAAAPRLRSGGAPEAVERFCEFATDGAFRQLDPALRTRMLCNGRALFGTELGWESYHPDDTTLAGISVPVDVFAGRDSTSLFREAAAWLAARLGTVVQDVPGGHVPMFTHPEELAASIRPLFRRGT